MKFIKEFAAHKKEVIPIETLFTDDEFEGIKDLYRDLVEDLNLTDVTDPGVPMSMDCNLSYFSKINWKDGSSTSDIFRINISIRTANLDELEIPDIKTDYQQSEKYNSISRGIKPFIDTLKSMGYQIDKRDIIMYFQPTGIKISITK